MTYSTHDKYGSGEHEYLDEEWKTFNDLTVDKATSTVIGNIPEDAHGYYINLSFKIGETTCEISSVYTVIE